MSVKKRALYRALPKLMVLLFTMAWGLGIQVPAQVTIQADHTKAFKQFKDRVDEYLKLHRAVDKTLPPLKGKEELPEMIAAHQQALARKIREARPHAKPDDIFTHDTHKAFREAIRSVFQNHPQTAHSAVRQKDSTRPVRLQVNGIYPDAVAETNVPPALLQKLPILPDELSYRIVGRELVLVDNKADLVVDILHEALP